MVCTRHSRREHLHAAYTYYEMCTNIVFQQIIHSKLSQVQGFSEFLLGTAYFIVCNMRSFCDAIFVRFDFIWLFIAFQWTNAFVCHSNAHRKCCQARVMWNAKTNIFGRSGGGGVGDENHKNEK